MTDKEHQLKRLLKLCQEYRIVCKKNNLVGTKKHKQITKIAKIAKEVIKKQENKQVDVGGKLEKQLQFNGEPMPLLLRDNKGNLFYVDLYPESYIRPLKDEATDIKGEENKVALTLQFYKKILLFTVEGEAVFAEVITEYIIIIVEKNKDGSPNYQKENIKSYKQIPLGTEERVVGRKTITDENGMKQVIDNVKPVNVFKKEYKKNQSDRENCIGHTVTNKKDEVWISPTYDNTTNSGEYFENVKKMIEDADCEELGSNEELAQKDDLIVFRCNEELAKAKKFKLTEDDVGRYIHAALYNGGGTYNSKNGLNPLNEKTSLKELMQVYSDDYIFFRRKEESEIMQDRIVLDEGVLTEIRGVEGNIMFQGKTILTKNELEGLSEKEMIGKAEKEIKKMIEKNDKKWNEEGMQEALKVVLDYKKALTNAKFTK